MQLHGLCAQDSRDKLFEDYVELGGNVEEMILKFEARHSETKQSNEMGVSSRKMDSGQTW